MAKTVAYYLSKGFDQAAAEYYAAGRRKIVSVEPNDDFTSPSASTMVSVESWT